MTINAPKPGLVFLPILGDRKSDTKTSDVFICNFNSHIHDRLEHQMKLNHSSNETQSLAHSTN